MKPSLRVLGTNSKTDAKDVGRLSCKKSQKWRKTVLSVRNIIRKFFIAAMAVSVLSASVGGGDNVPPGIRVELDNQKSLSLRVTVWSRAEQRVTFYKSRLPWGNRNSMIFVPVNSDGQCIGERLLPVDDSGFQKLSLDPNESITGDIDLRRFVPELEKALKKSDVHLFWAYAPPEELRIGRWSGGWILIPQQK